MSSLNYLSFFLAAFLLISCVHSQDYTWNLKGLKTQLKANQPWLSPIFPLKAFPFSAQAKLEVKSDNVVYLSLAYKDPKKSGNDVINLTVVPAVSYAYKDPNNQDEPRNNKCFSIANTDLTYDRFYYEMWLRPYFQMADDNISITISVQKLAAGNACITDVQ